MANIKITNARLSFPSLFKKASFQGAETKYEATFIIPKKGNEKWYDDVTADIEKYAKDAKIKIPADKKFIKDGDDMDRPEYVGAWIVKAANTKRPTTINRDRSQVVEEDEIFYSGCYVNGIIEPWIQNNQFGKRCNANLLGIQFVKDGESFEGSFVASSDDFDEMDDDL
jgi:hypothetical protein